MSKPDFTYQTPANHQWTFSTWSSVCKLVIENTTTVRSSFTLDGTGVYIPIVDKTLKFTRVMATDKSNPRKERISIAGIYRL